MENAQGLLSVTPALDAISDSEDNWGNAGEVLCWDLKERWPYIGCGSAVAWEVQICHIIFCQICELKYFDQMV